MKNESCLGFETLLLIHAAPQIPILSLHLLLFLTKFNSSGNFISIYCFSYSFPVPDSQIHVSQSLSCFRDAFPDALMNNYKSEAIISCQNLSLFPLFLSSEVLPLFLPQSTKYKAIFNLYLIPISH